MQIEFEQGGVTYRAEKLDVFKQLHVSRKIAPMVPKLIPVFVKLQKGGDGALRDDLAGLADACGPFAEALAGMSDPDVEYVVKTCLSVVRRNQGGTYAPLVSSDGSLMFADMGLGETLPIVVRVIRENLGNFIQGLLVNQADTSAAP